MNTPMPSHDLDAIEQIEELIEAENASGLYAALKQLPPSETAYTISHLDDVLRPRLFALLLKADAGFAADLLEHFGDTQAADLIAELHPEQAAVIVEEMDSDEQADVLSAVDEEAVEAILQELSPETAEDVRQRLSYAEDTAGGLMITEYLAYPAEEDVSHVRQDLRRNSDRYNEYEVRYVYTLDEQGGLVGVVPMRRLVMAHAGEPLRHATVNRPTTVQVDTHLEELEDLFDRVDFNAVPVLDETGRLVGIVQRAAVQEAQKEAAEGRVGKLAGIIGGEERRSMPAGPRALRRLAFLLPVMGFTLLSASVVWIFQDTIERFPALAAFLPVVAGLCGSGGGQSVAVSIRELSLGLLRVGDMRYVLWKELLVAIIMGSSLGCLMFLITWFWEGHLEMALVVGGSLAMVMVVATSVGGAVPVILRGMGLDPAMLSMPLVQTMIDLTAFFTVLSLATLVLARLAGTMP